MSSLAKAFATKVNACGAFLAEQSGLRALRRVRQGAYLLPSTLTVTRMTAQRLNFVFK